MKSDYEIQMDVMDQLKWDPRLEASEIGVSVKNGIVTLSGQVDTFSKKMAAENAARKVFGVRAVAEDIQVGPLALFPRNDTEIAQSVLSALRMHTSVPYEKIRVTVENGFVTLEGDAEWEFQRSAAKAAVENVSGVKSVMNHISIKTKASVSEVKDKIRAAFMRSALIDASNVFIDIIGNKAVLRGKVRSYAEKDDAEEAAWCAPGITQVENKLELVPDEVLTF
jgi:osmotically-inducible protein OsmY